jgi:hypothetical protein
MRSFFLSELALDVRASSIPVTQKAASIVSDSLHVRTFWLNESVVAESLSVVGCRSRPRTRPGSAVDGQMPK